MVKTATKTTAAQATGQDQPAFEPSENDIIDDILGRVIAMAPGFSAAIARQISDVLFVMITLGGVALLLLLSAIVVLLFLLLKRARRPYSMLDRVNEGQELTTMKPTNKDDDEANNEHFTPCADGARRQPRD